MQPASSVTTSAPNARPGGRCNVAAVVTSRLVGAGFATFSCLATADPSAERADVVPGLLASPRWRKSVLFSSMPITSVPGGCSSLAQVAGDARELVLLGVKGLGVDAVVGSP